MSGPMCGGTSDARPVSEDVKALVEKVRPKAEEHLGKKFSLFEPVSMKSQVVAGANYFVKVKVAVDEFIHLRIYRHFSGDTQLHGVTADKKDSDELEYFEQNLH